MESSKIIVRISDFAIGRAPAVLVTQGIGSCVAVCLYEKEQKLGALAHIMLPKTIKITTDGDKVNPLRFVNTALPIVIKELEKEGAVKEGLSAKLVGGAHMFRVLGSAEDDLGAKNIKAAEELLAGVGIKIDNEEVGGNVGRSLEFDLETGVVNVTTKM